MWFSLKLVQDDNGGSANSHPGHFSGDAGTSSDVPKHFNLVPEYLETCFSLQIPEFLFESSIVVPKEILIVLVGSDHREIAGWSREALLTRW